MRLSAITKYHGGLPPFLIFRVLPPRVGKADAPWLLILTITLGRIESNMRKNNEGKRKKTARIPRVPTTSTFSGGNDRTIVLQVYKISVSMQFRFILSPLLTI